MRSAAVSFGKRESGASLIIGLMLLVIVTLLGLSMSSLSTSNLKIVRNYQNQQARLALAQRAVEQVLSNASYFTAPSSPVNVTNTGSMQVAVSDRTCTRSYTATGYSATSGIAPIDTAWSFTVTVTDPQISATTVVTQGVKLKMLAGSCT
jgi:Tfp pilus assembly protein PilX